MTDEEILQKAIEKAVKNGYGGSIVTEATDREQNNFIEHTANTFLRWPNQVFSHDFAKAICKGMERGVIAKGDNPETTNEEVAEPHLWFLQQMVLLSERKRIKYLKKFL